MNRWVEAARPRTLAAALVPVLVGTAAAERLVVWRAAAALTVALSIQVAVNYANDLFDARSGVDSADRIGPRRVVAARVVTPAEMKIAIGIALGIASVAGVLLSVATQPWLIGLGALCFAAALGYSGGPRPYASRALGEVFVFVFFGLVATVGSAFVQDEGVALVAVAAAVPVGLLASAILVANNVRDVDTDARAGKRTLAVVLGGRRTRLTYRALVAGALASTVAVAVADADPWPLAALAAAPFAVPAWRLIGAGDPATLISALGATTRLHLAYGVALAGGLWMS